MDCVAGHRQVVSPDEKTTPLILLTNSPMGEAPYALKSVVWLQIGSVELSGKFHGL
jgi:hypothetical protein